MTGRHKAGIYIVDADDGDEVARLTRYVLIADSAEDAALLAGRMTWPSATTPELNEKVRGQGQETVVVVGRIGTYDPGTVGAYLSKGAAIAIQRIGQR